MYSLNDNNLVNFEFYEQCKKHMKKYLSIHIHESKSPFKNKKIDSGVYNYSVFKTSL